MEQKTISSLILCVNDNCKQNIFSIFNYMIRSWRVFIVKMYVICYLFNKEKMIHD